MDVLADLLFDDVAGIMVAVVSAVMVVIGITIWTMFIRNSGS